MPSSILVHPSRRTVLGAGAAAFAAQFVRTGRAQQSRASGSLYAYVGCYTSEKRHARGDGIHVYRVDAETGAWTHIQRVGDLVNPSFLVMSRDGRFLYSVHGDETYATAFSVDPATGQLTVLNRAATGGSNGVHHAIDPTGRFLIVANYGSGTVAVMPIHPDGTLADAAQVTPLKGTPGPNRTEQAASHPHHIVFDRTGKFVVVPDKGLDRVFTFGFDSTGGRLIPTTQGCVAARPGSGPRHAAFHPTLPILWVLNEIGSSVTTYYWEAEHAGLRPVRILPTLPSDYVGENASAEIAVSPGGKFVYCSNRGHDSIAIFAADPEGMLTPAGWAKSQGKTPRFITFDPAGRQFYCANEQADTIVPFRQDSATGGLTPAGQPVKNASAVAIAFGG